MIEINFIEAISVEFAWQNCHLIFLKNFSSCRCIEIFASMTGLRMSFSITVYIPVKNNLLLLAMLAYKNISTSNDIERKLSNIL